MANKVFVSSIIVLWLSSMSWLVAVRILPSFGGGEPPLAESMELGKPVAWRVDCNGTVVGQAASVRMEGIGGTIDLHNRLRLVDFPLLELAPRWMRLAVEDIGKMTFDARTRIEFDPLGNLASFDSRVSLNNMPDAVLRLSGRLRDTCLELKVSSGSFSNVHPVYIPASNSLNEALFPAARLTDLRIGRSWKEKVYSPFRSPGDPVELVQAEVVGDERLQMGEEIIKVFRVEYRSDSRSGVPDKSRLVAVSWIQADNGDVLRRDVNIGSSKLRFERVFGKEAEEIGKELFDSIFQYDSLRASNSRKRHRRIPALSDAEP